MDIFRAARSYFVGPESPDALLLRYGVRRASASAASAGSGAAAGGGSEASSAGGTSSSRKRRRAGAGEASPAGSALRSAKRPRRAVTPQSFPDLRGSSEDSDDGAAARPVRRVRRGGASGRSGAKRCICGCGAAATHRLASLDLLEDGGSLVRAQLRALGVKWRDVSALVASAVTAGRAPPDLRVSGRHWTLFQRNAAPDKKWSARAGSYVTSAGCATPTSAARHGSATRRMSAVVRSASFPAVAKEAGLAAADVDALQRELASSQQQVAALKAALDAAKMERAAAAAASPAMVTIGGAVLAGFRFARIAHNDRLCKRLYSVTGDVVRALTDVLLKLGYDDTPLATAEEFNRAYYAASGSAQAPNVALTAQASTMGVRVRGKGGRATVFDAYERVAFTLFTLRTDIRMRVSELFYAVDEATLGRYFTTTLIALDNAWPLIFPPWTRTQAAELTPLSLLNRVTGGDINNMTSIPMYQIDCKEVFRQAPSANLAHGIAFSNYKNRSTDKFLVLTHAAGGTIWVSDALAGSISDNQAISHLYPIIKQYVPKGSTIFCDKGAAISHFAPLAIAAGHDWRVPAKKTQGEKFAKAEVDDQAFSGAARVVVENVIGGAHNRFAYVRNGMHGVLSGSLHTCAVRACFMLANFGAPLRGASGVGVAATAADSADGNDSADDGFGGFFREEADAEAAGGESD